jgi:hypothetical protein
MRLLATLALFASFSAVACPDLSGSYKLCITSGDVTGTDLVITQQRVNGAMTYTSVITDPETGSRDTDTIIADGKERVTEAEDGFTERDTYACRGNTLVGRSVLEFEGQKIGSVDVVVRKEGSRLVSEISGEIGGETLKETQICE